MPILPHYEGRDEPVRIYMDQCLYRTLTSLKDLYKFHMNGDNEHDVKSFHNVIYRSLFDVPIYQVNPFL